MKTERTLRPGRRLSTTLVGLLLAAIVVGCAADSPAPTEEQSSPAEERGLSVEQLRDLPPPESEVAALMGMPEGLTSGPDEGLSQVLEGIEAPESLDYYGYAYSASTGNPNKGGDFSSVGVLSILNPESGAQELFRELTTEDLGMSEDEQWASVEVDGASEASSVFVTVRNQGFVVDATTARRGRLVLFITVLSSEEESRPEIGVRVAELVFQNAADLGG